MSQSNRVNLSSKPTLNNWKRGLQSVNKLHYWGRKGFPRRNTSPAYQMEQSSLCNRVRCNVVHTTACNYGDFITLWSWGGLQFDSNFLALSCVDCNQLHRLVFNATLWLARKNLRLSLNDVSFVFDNIVSSCTWDSIGDRSERVTITWNVACALKRMWTKCQQLLHCNENIIDLRKEPTSLAWMQEMFCRIVNDSDLRALATKQQHMKCQSNEARKQKRFQLISSTTSSSREEQLKFFRAQLIVPRDGRFTKLLMNLLSTCECGWN